MNASSLAYQTIRTKILSQEFGPGSRLKEVQLCKTLGLTRTPVREAIIRLKHEGLILASPNRGASVVQFSGREIEELFEVREALEWKAVHLAIWRANRDDLTKIRIALKDRERLFSQSPTGHYQPSPVDFHHEILKLSKNEKLISIWETLQAQLTLIRVRSAMIEQRYVKALEEHKQILFYMAKGNFKRTEESLRNHLLRAKENLLSH